MGALSGLLLVYVTARIGVSSGRLGGAFFLPHLLIFPMVYLLLRLAPTDWLARGLLERPWFSRTVGLIGGSTLEVYLIHYQVLNTPFIASLVFPVNVVVFLVVSVVLRAPPGRRRRMAAGLLSKGWALEGINPASAGREPRRRQREPVTEVIVGGVGEVALADQPHPIERPPWTDWK